MSEEEALNESNPAVKQLKQEHQTLTQKHEQLFVSLKNASVAHDKAAEELKEVLVKMDDACKSDPTVKANLQKYSGLQKLLEKITAIQTTHTQVHTTASKLSKGLFPEPQREQATSTSSQIYTPPVSSSSSSLLSSTSASNNATPINGSIKISSKEEEAMLDRVAGSVPFDVAIKELSRSTDCGGSELLPLSHLVRYLKRLEALPSPTEEVVKSTGAGKILTKITKLIPTNDPTYQGKNSPVVFAKRIIEKWKTDIEKKKQSAAAKSALKTAPKVAAKDVSKQGSSNSAQSKTANPKSSNGSITKSSNDLKSSKEKRTREEIDDEEWERRKLQKYRESVGEIIKEEKRSAKIGRKEDREAIL